MFTALAKAGYPILQLKSMDLSLEDIFIKLTEDKKRVKTSRNKQPKKVKPVDAEETTKTEDVEDSFEALDVNLSGADFDFEEKESEN